MGEKKYINLSVVFVVSSTFAALTKYTDFCEKLVENENINNNETKKIESNCNIMSDSDLVKKQEMNQVT
jgi:hypothetical protein